MPRLFRCFALIYGWSWLPLACSSSDPAPSSNGGAGAPAGGGAPGNPGGSGGSAAGSHVGGGATSSAGSSNAGSAGAFATGGGAGAAAGAGGSVAGSAGSGPASCTPASGTMAVGDRSILDRKTCLTWTKTRTSMTMTNKQAAKYCADLAQDGISDWRVPHPEELVTWPDLATDGTAYITGPVYVPTAGTVQDGCTGNSHSCNIAKYNDSSVTCAWQGVGFAGWVECVSGTAAAGTTSPAYAAATCSPCNGELATFKETDCSQYAN